MLHSHSPTPFRARQNFRAAARTYLNAVRRRWQRMPRSILEQRQGILSQLGVRDLPTRSNQPAYVSIGAEAARVVLRRVHGVTGRFQFTPSGSSEVARLVVCLDPAAKLAYAFLVPTSQGAAHLSYSLADARGLALLTLRYNF
jgi:hypothetical protein